MKDILKTIFVIIGTMIGAGFASGQEIYLFFNRYGTMGILGLIISCTLAGIIIYKVFQIVKNKKNTLKYLVISKKDVSLHQSRELRC